MRSATWSRRVRVCRFELLEHRQVLSATFSLDALATPKLHLARPYASATLPSSALTPAQVRQAYGFNTVVLPGGVPADGRGMTIAIVDAFNNPTIISDLQAFNTQFGLQQFNVPGGPTFKVVNQRGSTLLPSNNFDWAGEIALDVEWAHAIAPRANILLVEATNNSILNLASAVAYARSAAGVVVVSNSYGGGEGLGEEAFDFYFTSPAGHPGVTFVFSAGDDGAPAEYPSSSPNVLSVGGTTLKLTSSNNYSSEIVWANSTGAGGGGASLYENVPNYQLSLGLTRRGTPDVSYNGDPSSGVAVYSSFAFGAATPWEVIGGTSAGAPQWAALIAIADQGRAFLGKNSLVNAQAVMYKLPSTDFHDITLGNNGNSAGAGYDLATGLGSPIANLVIRDLIAYNGSILLPANRTAMVGGSNGSWYFFAKPRAAGGGAGDAALTSLSDSSAATNATNSLPSVAPRAADYVSAYLAAVQDEGPVVTVSSHLAANSLDDNPWLSHRGAARRHAAADDVAADACFAQI